MDPAIDEGTQVSDVEANTPRDRAPSPGLLDVADQLVSSVDRLVPVSDEPANKVLVDNARLVRWATPLFAGCALILLPWTIVLGTTLPQRQLSHNYGLAWTGYDVVLLVGLIMTAVAAIRRSKLLPIAASATGALLTADAWFDVLTSPGGWSRVQAIAMSLIAELPLAGTCFWLSAHSQAVSERRILLLQRKRSETQRG